jgi:hypothetical protein
MYNIVADKLLRTTLHLLPLQTMSQKKRKSFFRTLFHRLTRTHSRHEPTPTSATTIAATHAPVNKVNHSHSESEVISRETRVSSELQSNHSASVIEQRSRGYKDTPDALRSSNIDRKSGDPWEHAYELAKLELTGQEWKSISDSADGAPSHNTVMEQVTLAQNKKQLRHRKKYQKIVKGLDKYAGIVDVAIQHSPEITALVWAGARFLLQACEL